MSTIYQIINDAKEGGWETYKNLNITEYTSKGFIVEDLLYVSMDSIIFTNEFLEAFFGKDWHKHVEPLIFADSKLKYLEDFSDQKYRNKT